MPTRRALTAIAAASLAPLASPPFAVGALAAVEIVDRSRHVPLVTFHHRGNAGVAGRPGDRDAVRLRESESSMRAAPPAPESTNCTVATFS